VSSVPIRLEEGVVLQERTELNGAVSGLVLQKATKRTKAEAQRRRGFVRFVSSVPIRLEEGVVLQERTELNGAVSGLVLQKATKRTKEVAWLCDLRFLL
ncbi:hypothetical protein, partial [Synoicihabitans lomoniglobus]|uniref:hypothetical protein n=1 Tax=Synoicihabitans lomoniglobus TaxID=2909285 RepID=UPI002ED6AE0D|nr:hypothetical protein [Opitutaceae bacterium LMO-M01]